jgi:hypothetical protein
LAVQRTIRIQNRDRCRTATIELKDVSIGEQRSAPANLQELILLQTIVVEPLWVRQWRRTHSRTVGAGLTS